MLLVYTISVIARVILLPVRGFSLRAREVAFRASVLPSMKRQQYLDEKHWKIVGSRQLDKSLARIRRVSGA